MPVLHLVRIMPFYSRKTTNAYQNKYPIRLWQKHKEAISACEASRKKFTGPKKGQIPEIDDAIFKFFLERCKTGLFVIYGLLRKETIKRPDLRSFFEIVLTFIPRQLKPVNDGP